MIFASRNSNVLISQKFNGVARFDWLRDFDSAKRTKGLQPSFLFIFISNSNSFVGFKAAVAGIYVRARAGAGTWL